MASGHVHGHRQRISGSGEEASAVCHTKRREWCFAIWANGKFEELIEEAGSGVAAAHCSRGCAFGDFDNDGDVDILVINLNEPPSLLRNDLKGKQHWLKVKLEGVKSNRSAIGARIVAHYGGKSQAQAVLSQSSFYSSNDPRLHFGLGSHTSADLILLAQRRPRSGKERSRQPDDPIERRCRSRFQQRISHKVVKHLCPPPHRETRKISLETQKSLDSGASSILYLRPITANVFS